MISTRDSDLYHTGGHQAASAPYSSSSSSSCLGPSLVGCLPARPARCLVTAALPQSLQSAHSRGRGCWQTSRQSAPDQDWQEGPTREAPLLLLLLLPPLACAPVLLACRVEATAVVLHPPHSGPGRSPPVLQSSGPAGNWSCAGWRKPSSCAAAACCCA
jgi:hypothetical protein